MRNLLTHGYAEIDPRRLMAVLQHHLSDIETPLSFVGKIVKDPSPFGLSIE
ncbi:DUF86 domain-containing protein [Candidatus Uhrbacteria bacterium]|nr:DUF86 domain-containing protein [Candidatus Uhrbacteria bacterium]